MKQAIINWGNSASVQMFLTTALAVAVSVIAVVQPGFKDPAWVQTLVPVLATLIAYVVHSKIFKTGTAKAAAKALSGS